ncbi:MAG TPA: hypothetical protein VLE26_05805, partial [Alphaproteobacteria bacterium]|nr:hypothetical protein [Alphaproteobacteria bacterium]
DDRRAAPDDGRAPVQARSLTEGARAAFRKIESPALRIRPGDPETTGAPRPMTGGRLFKPAA